MYECNYNYPLITEIDAWLPTLRVLNNMLSKALKNKKKNKEKNTTTKKQPQNYCKSASA